MLNRLHVTRARLIADEDAVLAEAVMNAQQAVALTPDQRVVRDCDEYLASVMMDGHLLTFINNGIDRMNDFGKALADLPAVRELDLFRQAIELWKESGYQDFGNADDALNYALNAIDQQFYDAAGTKECLETRIKHYVRDYPDAFMIVQ